MTMDRKKACDEYLKLHEFDRYGALHIIVDDYNFEDHWLIPTIAKLAIDLISCDSPDIRRQLFFVVDLMKLPMPEGWDGEDD
jgi:hypothetical protein